MIVFFSVVASCIGAMHSRYAGHSSLHVESHAALRRSRPNLEIPLSIKCIGPFGEMRGDHTGETLVEGKEGQPRPAAWIVAGP